MKHLFVPLLAWFALTAPAADPIFSGPQPGEKATPFKVRLLTGDDAGKEAEVTTERATAVVFVHTIERSLVPLLRVVDEYGALRKDRLQTELVFLAADRLEGERRVKAAASSLKLKTRVSLSVDGAEGPGNYGLNKECMMTIVATKAGRVTTNFALLQPGIADAPRVVAALAKTCGDEAPPTVEQLNPRPPPRGEGMQRTAEKGARPTTPLPGAAPTDPKLLGLLRRFIQKSNDDATVDKVLTEVRDYVKESPGLRQQAVDGWVRVLHLRYGTEHAVKAGQTFVDALKQETK